ncbi:MAG: methyltransferase domain-containing protein, partial [Promethearchaeota archaeon]
MYKELAKYYDLIYSWKDYRKETNKIEKLIKKYKKSDGNKLLDVACGTGKHVEYLKENFSCTGIDLNVEMINIA